MEDKIKEAINAYNKIAQLYFKYNYTKLLQFQLNKFISMLPGKKVLDLGCGPGRDMEYFLEEGIDAIGVDYSEEMLKLAEKIVSKDKLKHADFKNLKFKENSFDGLWCVASFSDVPKAEGEETLRKWLKILKKEGIIFISVKEGSKEEVVQKEKYQNVPRFYAYYTVVELEELLKKVGFEIVSSGITEEEDENWVEIFAKKA